MKTSKIFYLSLFSLFVLSACQPPAPATTSSSTTSTSSITITPPKTETPAPAGTSISLDTPFTLKPGQTATFAPNSSTITFVSVEGDSRCPSDVQCIWAGEATVNLKIDGFKPTNDNIQAYSMTTMDNMLDLGVGEGNSYALELSDLTPYPGSKTSITTADYQATFKLTAKQ